MKLLRYGPVGQEKPGMLDSGGALRDLSGVVDDIAGDVLSPSGLARLRSIRPESLPAVAGKPRVGACVGRIPKLVCVGLNYLDHAKEAGLPPPAEPPLFMKAVSSVQGPDDEVMIPKGSAKTDWEIELAVVIGSRANHVSEAEALKYVAGYCIANDVSERAFQIERGGQWMKGKGCDTFGPIGPWLVTTDEVPDPQKLELRLSVNGTVCQNGNTSEMIFGVAKIVSYISEFMSLMPGDLVLTGTPAGVGMGAKPQRFLRPGDIMDLTIPGLGAQRQKLVAYRPVGE